MVNLHKPVRLVKRARPNVPTSLEARFWAGKTTVLPDSIFAANLVQVGVAKFF